MLFGGKGLVATPQQKIWQEQMEQQFGLGLPGQDQTAVNQYAQMPVEPKQQPNWGQGLSDIGTGLMAAQAAIDGNFAGSAQLSQSIGAEQRAAAERLAKAKAERNEWVWREQYKKTNEVAAQPYRFEDNAGNVYERGADGQNRLIFTDPNERQFVVDGQLVRVPNVVRQQQGGATPPILDALPPGAKLIGGAGQQAPRNFPVPSGNPLDPWPR